MKKTIDSSQDFFYPDEREMRSALRGSCGRCCLACESPVEYAFRKRKTDLSALLDRAIEKELTEKERTVIRDIYFKEMTASAAAVKEGVSRATVSKTHERAKEKLRRVLEYVVIYQDGFDSAENVDLRLSEAFTISASAGRKGAFPGGILRQIRLSLGVDIPKAARASGLDEKRIREIEEGRITPGTKDIHCLCGAYGVRPEDILKNGRTCK